VTDTIAVACRPQLNGVEVSFINCDGSPHSYVALFTNYAERPAFNHTDDPYEVDVCDGQMLVQNPSARLMPAEYFTFVESQAGGCGFHMQTITVTAAVGFR